MKIGKSFWLSLAVLLGATLLAFIAYHNSYSSAKAAAINPQLAASIEFDNNCLDCHVPGLPDTTWYCHSVLPSENYNTRMYLGDHIDWITSHMIVPAGLYRPLLEQLPESQVQVHLFDRGLFQSFSSITVGTRVTWTNLDIRDHTLLSQNDANKWPFESVVLKPGESVSYTFTEPGIYNYTYEYLDFRPSETAIYQTVKGKITVLTNK